MREPRTIDGARAPLFDRLSAPDAGAASRVLDQRGLRKSVLDELTRLLNTRSSPEPAVARLAAGSTLDYGIPDLAWASPANEAELDRLAAELARRIAAHEPRLANVRVTIERLADGLGAAHMVLTASLRAGPVFQPVSFSVTLDPRDGRPEAAHAAEIGE